MATRPIGSGTVNLSVNMPKGEHEALAKMLDEEKSDSSLSNLVRRLYMERLEAVRSDIANEIKAAREAHRKEKIANSNLGVSKTAKKMSAAMISSLRVPKKPGK